MGGILLSLKDLKNAGIPMYLGLSRKNWGESPPNAAAELCSAAASFLVIIPRMVRAVKAFFHGTLLSYHGISEIWP